MNRFKTNTNNFQSLVKEFDEIFNFLDQKSNDHYPKEFFVELPLPGLTKEDVSINFKDNMLIISMELKEPTGFIKRYKNEYYRYYLNDYHDLDNIEAKMNNGLLSIKVPIKQDKKMDPIKITIR